MLERDWDSDRVDSALPRDLGIHSAIPTAAGNDDLPEYVERDFDFKLRTALSANLPQRGSFVVLIGGSSTGKTRSLYEAIYDLVPDWRLSLPTAAADLLALRNAPPTRTVFWLDELQRYLGSDPPLTPECILALEREGNLVVGTLWPDQYARWTVAGGETQQLVKRAVPISVPDDLTATELDKANEAADRDGRIRSALDTRDSGMTQALAGGPSLVMRWEQPATPYTRAIITAAADAHRLGVQSPLNEDLLGEAMYGYLRPHQRAQPRSYQMAQALPHAIEPLYGDVSALYEVDDGRPGTHAGFTVADYLAQHLRRERRTRTVPASTWRALAAQLRRAEDLWSLADSALARLRLGYAELALNRLVHEFGDGRAAAELADLLIRQDRLDEAATALRHQLNSGRRDRVVEKKLGHVAELRERVADVRPPAGPRTPDFPEEVAELLADVGVCDALRRRASGGDVLAAEKLVEHLADRGCVRELRDRAEQDDPLAAEKLADLYAAWGDEDLLVALADAGHRAAELRLSKMHRISSRGENARWEIAARREAVDEGRPEAAVELCTLLFELRDEDNLRAEVDAGTSGAADRLIALYTAQGHESLSLLRAFGLDADGQLVTPKPHP